MAFHTLLILEMNKVQHVNTGYIQMEGMRRCLFFKSQNLGLVC